MNPFAVKNLLNPTVHSDYRQANATSSAGLDASRFVYRLVEAAEALVSRRG